MSLGSLSGLYSIFVFLLSLRMFSSEDNDNEESIANEALYTRHFKDDPEEYQSWPYAQKWFTEPGQHKLKRFCALAHSRSGRSHCDVNLVLYQMRSLTFENANHSRRHIDIIEYGCREGAEPEDMDEYWTVIVDDRWYITQGTKWDCVFYLTRVNATVEFMIEAHVCGVKIYELSYTLITSSVHKS